MSLDGFIAGPNGEYDWIKVDPVEAGPFFEALYAQFDIAVMGRKTFELVSGAVQGMRTSGSFRSFSAAACRSPPRPSASSSSSSSSAIIHR
jgi:dihydrofolate reductase